MSPGRETAVRRRDRTREPGGAKECAGRAVFRLPTPDFHYMTFSHVAVISCASPKNETYRRVDIIFLKNKSL
jgi:hypothetical protein